MLVYTMYFNRAVLTALATLLVSLTLLQIPFLFPTGFPPPLNFFFFFLLNVYPCTPERM